MRSSARGRGRARSSSIAGCTSGGATTARGRAGRSRAYRDGSSSEHCPLRPAEARTGVTSFVGGDPALADLLLAEDEDLDRRSARRKRRPEVRTSPNSLACPPTASLVAALGPSALTLIERSEAPVLDLIPDWATVYRVGSSREAAQPPSPAAPAARGARPCRRRRRDYPRRACRSAEDAFVLHDRRWQGRPDGSDFTTPVGRRSTMRRSRRSAPLRIPRIVALKIDGRPSRSTTTSPSRGGSSSIGSHSTPSTAASHPGWSTRSTRSRRRRPRAPSGSSSSAEPSGTRSSLQTAWSRSMRARARREREGRAAVAGRLAMIRTRKLLKRSPALRRFYFEGLARRGGSCGQAGEHATYSRRRRRERGRLRGRGARTAERRPGRPANPLLPPRLGRSRRARRQPARLPRQMDYLATEAYRVVDVVQAATSSSAAAFRRTVGLSFDDGFLDVAEQALPILAERGFRATVFVAPAVIDGWATFAWYRTRSRAARLGGDRRARPRRNAPLRGPLADAPQPARARRRPRGRRSTARSGARGSPRAPRGRVFLSFRALRGA